VVGPAREESGSRERQGRLGGGGGSNGYETCAGGERTRVEVTYLRKVQPKTWRLELA
jgi:hypothetical protein